MLGMMKAASCLRSDLCDRMDEKPQQSAMDTLNQNIEMYSILFQFSIVAKKQSFGREECHDVPQEQRLDHE